MRRRFACLKVGRFRRSAARGMARAGFSAMAIRLALGIPLAKAIVIVETREAPGALWQAAELALFRDAA